MSKGIDAEGTIIAVYRNRYEVRLIERSDIVVSAVPSGRIRNHRVWLTPGDRVLLDLCPYDMTKGRILRRL